MRCWAGCGRGAPTPLSSLTTTLRRDVAVIAASLVAAVLGISAFALLAERAMNNADHARA